jgi:uncharacterized damage-inducible protein DinB
MSKKLLTSLFQYKAWTNREMFKVLRSIPPGQHATEMIIITVTMDHVTTVDRIFRANLLGEPHSFTTVISSALPTLEALADTARKTDSWYIDYIQSASDADLAEGVDFTFVIDGMPGHMTREEMLGHVLTHGNSHRGAVGKILETIQVSGPPDMFTTFLHRDANVAHGL